MEYDVFICHASEDKESFVEPLANTLKEAGLSIWYDRFALKLGDSLREKIDQGLANSRYGVVVLSRAFFSKEWPKSELDALVTRQNNEGKKVILPIWHGVDVKEVKKFSPILASKLAAKSTDGIEAIVNQIRDVLNEIDLKPNSVFQAGQNFGSERAVFGGNSSNDVATWQLKQLKREALAASRCRPENIAMFEQKVIEIDLLEGVSSNDKINAFHELGQEVALNSDRGTIILTEHILWQLAGWDSPSIVKEIVGSRKAKQLLEHIAETLWDIGVNAVEYGREGNTIQTVANAILEVDKQARINNVPKAVAACKTGLGSMLTAARRDKRVFTIGLLEDVSAKIK